MAARRFRIDIRSLAHLVATRSPRLIRLVLVVLRFGCYTGSLHHGPHRWTMYKFERVEELAVSTLLTGGYVQNLPTSCPSVKKLDLLTDSFEWLTHVTKLDHLEDLRYSYDTEVENDVKKLENKKLFLRFLKKRGKQIQMLSFRMPFQLREFFSQLHCN